MLRDDEIDLSQHRPSRVSRVVVIASTLAVALIAAWVFAPILLANYTGATATVAAVPKAQLIAPERAAPRVAMTQAAAATTQAPSTTAIAATETETTASTASTAQPATQQVASAGSGTTAPWPTEAPAWPNNAPVVNVPATETTINDQRSDTMQLASTSAATATNDTAETPHVPLPRSRPSRTIAAHLMIPLPRPRPDIETDAPSAADRAFELQIQRMGQ